MYRKITTFVLGATLFAALAIAANAPTYTDADGRLKAAAGAITVNPDGTFQAVGTGAQGASVPRVTIAVDSATVGGSAAIPAGANVIGKTGVDQTTPGTTNAVVPTSSGGVNSLFSANNTDATAVNGTVNKQAVINQPEIFDGTNMPRQFTCPLTANFAITSGSTTQIVALVSAKIIYVCSYMVTESLAGTFAFVYGTGSNCATGQAAITGALNIATNDHVTQTGSSGGSVFRTASANALCGTAATGTGTGFVTYAQF